MLKSTQTCLDETSWFTNDSKKSFPEACKNEASFCRVLEQHSIIKIEEVARTIYRKSNHQDRLQGPKKNKRLGSSSVLKRMIS